MKMQENDNGGRLIQQQRSRQAGARPQALWVTSAQYGGFGDVFCV